MAMTEPGVQLDVAGWRAQLATSCRLLEWLGLIDHSGHVSARLPGTDRVLINPRPISRSAVTPEDLVTIDLDGRVVEGWAEPPGEYPIHTEIYRRRPDVAAVVHAHPPVATAASIAGRPLRPVFILGAALGEVPVYDRPDLILDAVEGRALAERLGDGRAVMIRGHGAAVAAATIPEAFVLTVNLEDNARKLLHSSALGEPRYFTPDEIERVARQTWKPKSVRKVWNHFVAKYEEAHGAPPDRGMWEGAADGSRVPYRVLSF